MPELACKKKSDPDGSPSWLIVFGHQHGCVFAICLSDEPELDPACGVIYRQKPTALYQCQFIFLPVVFVHVAPIPGLVPSDGAQDVIWCQLFKGVRRGDDLAKSKPGQRNDARTHDTPPATMSCWRMASTACSISSLVNVHERLGSSTTTAHLKR